MKQNKIKVFSSAIVGILFLFLFGSCTSSKTSTSFDREYAETWKKVLQTQAWKDALNGKEKLGSDDAILEKNDAIVKPTAVFTKKYNSLVSRAYFKIISSAEKASKNIKAEYNRLDSEKNIEKNRKNKEYKNSLELAGKRYKAHNNMLEGLKSWKIFTDDITGDLKYFKAENENQIHNMYLNGDTDDSMINILVYKLADLYHFEE